MRTWQRIGATIAVLAFVLSFLGTVAGCIPHHGRDTYTEIR